MVDRIEGGKMTILCQYSPYDNTNLFKVILEPCIGNMHDKLATLINQIITKNLTRLSQMIERNRNQPYQDFCQIYAENSE